MKNINIFVVLAIAMIMYIIVTKIGLSNMSLLTRSPSQTTNKQDSEQSENKNLTVHRPPDVLILGVKKCGTETLARFLNYHPNIAGTGEVKFFENDKNYAKGWNYYLNKMPAAR